MNKILPLAIVLIIVAGFFYVVRNKNLETKVNETVTSTPLNTSESNPNSDILKAGGSSYLDASGVYGFLYPNDYILDTNDIKHIRIYKRGESQRPQSEMSDGVLMVFESITLKSQTLEQWVDENIKQSTADGTSEVIQDKKAVTINNFPGFTYELRGLGSATYLVLQKDTKSTSAVVITYTVSDPEGHNYQHELDGILSTVKLYK